MKYILLFTVFFLFSLSNFVFSQSSETDRKHSVQIGVHHAILGEGDYGGTVITNQYLYKVFPSVEISPAIEFLTSSRFKEELPKDYYLSTQWMGNLSAYIIPINHKILHLKLGGGISLRSRKEITGSEIYFDEYGFIDIISEKKSSIDVGYTLQTIVGFNLTNYIFVDARLSLQNYNQGTQLVIYGLLAGYCF